MADTNTLQPTLQPEKKRTTVSQMIGGTFEDLTGDIFESITGIQNIPESPEAREHIKTPVPEYVKKAFTSGSIEDFNQARLKTEEKLIEEQRAAVAEAQSILRQTRAEFVTQQEIRYEVAGMSEEERNSRLKLNTSLRRVHTEDAYHMAELYRQVKSEVTAIEQREENTGIPNPAKQPNSLEVAFEGKSGSTGNLSFQAVG